MDKLRTDANKVLTMMVLTYLLTPGTMGSGRTSIEDKVATVIHEHNVESFDVDHTARMLREYAAFTSDLGVEAKVTDFCVKPGRLTDLMPTWMAARQARSPLTSSEELLESSEDIPRVSLPAQCTGDVWCQMLYRCRAQTILFTQSAMEWTKY